MRYRGLGEFSTHSAEVQLAVNGVQALFVLELPVFALFPEDSCY